MSDPAVFDCMVYLQAAARPERVHGCFEAVRHGELALFVSDEILAEIHDVLTRPKLQRQFPALTPEVVRAFLVDMLARATLVNEVPVAYRLPRDPKDEKYINLAVAVGARYLVSRDNDLLDLMDEATQDGREFRQRFPSLIVIKPGDLIRELETKRRGQ